MTGENPCSQLPSGSQIGIVVLNGEAYYCAGGTELKCPISCGISVEANSRCKRCSADASCCEKWGKIDGGCNSPGSSCACDLGSCKGICNMNYRCVAADGSVNTLTCESGEKLCSNTGKCVPEDGCCYSLDCSPGDKCANGICESSINNMNVPEFNSPAVILIAAVIVITYIFFRRKHA